MKSLQGEENEPDWYHFRSFEEHYASLASESLADSSALPELFIISDSFNCTSCGSLFDIVPLAQALAEDVRWYGEWMQTEAFKRIGHLYPKVKSPWTEKEMEISAWIWARTVKCPNPSCGCHIPLSSSYDLARKKGAEAWVEPVVEDGTVQFRIHRGPHTAVKGKPKVGQTAVFKCPACGEITTDAYVKECGVYHKISSQLIAIATDDGKKRVYLEPDTEQNTATDILPPKKVPHGTLPDYTRRFSPPSFGLTDYAVLFTNRQLVYLTTMMELADEVQNAAKKQALEKGFSPMAAVFFKIFRFLYYE